MTTLVGYALYLMVVAVGVAISTSNQTVNENVPWLDTSRAENRGFDQ